MVYRMYQIHAAIEFFNKWPAIHMPTVCLVAFKASCLLWYCGAFLPPPPPFFFLFVFSILLLGLLYFGILYSLRKLSWLENA